MLARSGSQPSSVDAVLTVPHALSWGGRKGWRAVIRICGGGHKSKRHFGTWRPSIIEAVASLLHKHNLRISCEEAQRIKQIAAAMQTRRAATVITSSRSLQLGNAVGPALDADSPAPSQVPNQHNGVRFVHQMYGLFGDEKPMSHLFQLSHHKWSEVASGMGAQYILWKACDVEALMKQRYPEFWDMYQSARYPIMRCDIGRLAIIHSYGGLYSDLDVLPNREWYAQVALGLPRVQVIKRLKSTRKTNRLSAKKRKPLAKSHTYLEMEVIIGEQGNELFVRWLEHIRQEIESKSYSQKSSFWYHAKMRYVYNTTGPMSMTRFLRLPINSFSMDHVKYLECNRFNDALALSNVDRRFFDVISYESNSYFTELHEILVPVGLGDSILPPRPSAKRMRQKCAARPMHVLAVQAPSQGMQALQDDDGAEAEPVAQAAQLVPAAAARESLDQELQQERDRARELKRFFRQHWSMVATKMVLQQMPEELSGWITAEWPQHRRDRVLGYA